MGEADRNLANGAERSRRSPQPGSAPGTRSPVADGRGRRARPVDHRLSDLWRPQRRQIQRHPGLPRADRRSACRQPTSRDRQAAAGGRPWSAPASRSTPTAFSSSARMCVGGCMGTTGPASINPATGEPYGLDLPARHDRRHGARPGHADRPSRHRHAVLRRRRLDGRHAGAAMGGELSRARLRALPIATAARHSSQNIAFHEVGRQAIMADPDWRGGALSRRRRAPGRRASPSRAWPPTSPISRKRAAAAGSAASCRIARERTFSFDADFQIESYLRHQGSIFVDRFDANSYLYHDARDGLFRPRRRLRRLAGARLQGLAARASASSPSPPTGCFRPAIRAPSSTRSTPAAPRCPSSRSRPTAATTPSCSTSRTSSPPPAASSTPPRGRAASRQRRASSVA